MAKRSKAYEAAVAKIEADKQYAPVEAITLAKESNPSKFDATVEVALRLSVDPRKADQMVRGTVNLPHGTGKTARVLVFAAGAKAQEAEAAGCRLLHKPYRPDDLCRAVDEALNQADRARES